MISVIGLATSTPGGVRAADVAHLTNDDAKMAGEYLRRAADSGRLTKHGRGLYGGVESVGSVGNVIPLPTLPTLPTPGTEADQ